MRQRMSAVGIAIIVLSAVVLGYGRPATATPTGDDAPILYTDSPNAVPGRYLVIFSDAAVAATAVSGKARDLTDRFGGQARHLYTAGLRGFSAALSDQQARRLAADPAVASIEAVQRIGVADTQNNPPNWGDDRIDQANLPLNQAFTYPANPGQGATVYVLDTGINANHVDFTGRVRPGIDMVDNDSSPTDCHGHGTHVAGTAAGTTYGVAKKASVVAVRVLNCQGSGSNDDLIAGIDWVRANAQKPAVVNYSIGCQSRCTSQAMDSAVSNLISSGVQFVQAAGNSSDNACYYSPQGVAAAVTVGNTTNADARNSSSNYGSCLDIFAPGTSIVSASYSSNTGSATMTGTSMASPHTAGAAAVYLGLNPGATPAQVRDALVNNATTGKVTNAGTGSPNRLLYTGFMNGGTNPLGVEPGQPEHTRRAAGEPADAGLGRHDAVHLERGRPARGPVDRLVQRADLRQPDHERHVERDRDGDRCHVADSHRQLHLDRDRRRRVHPGAGGRQLQPGERVHAVVGQLRRDRRLVRLRIPGPHRHPQRLARWSGPDAHRLRLPVGDDPGRVHQRRAALLGTDHDGRG